MAGLDPAISASHACTVPVSWMPGLKQLEAGHDDRDYAESSECVRALDPTLRLSNRKDWLLFYRPEDLATFALEEQGCRSDRLKSADGTQRRWLWRTGISGAGARPAQQERAYDSRPDPYETISRNRRGGSRGLALIPAAAYGTFRLSQGARSSTTANGWASIGVARRTVHQPRPLLGALPRRQCSLGNHATAIASP
jgi:hypothetical protein